MEFNVNHEQVFSLPIMLDIGVLHNPDPLEVDMGSCDTNSS